MVVEVFSLCDAATSDGGKLNMLGVFDTIWAKKIPAIHPQCTIALRFRFFSAERAEHKVSVNFVDADGKHIIPTSVGMIKVNFSDDRRSGASNLILNLQGLKLEKYGEYSIDLSVNDKNIASLPLFVRDPSVKK